MSEEIRYKLLKRCPDETLRSCIVCNESMEHVYELNTNMVCRIGGFLVFKEKCQAVTFKIGFLENYILEIWTVRVQQPIVLPNFGLMNSINMRRIEQYEYLWKEKYIPGLARYDRVTWPAGTEAWKELTLVERVT